jgi:hypothetical protein
VGPTDRRWRRGSLYKGDEERVLVHGVKEGRGQRGCWRGFFTSDLLYHCFFIGDGKGEPLKFL